MAEHQGKPIAPGEVNFCRSYFDAAAVNCLMQQLSIAKRIWSLSAS
jgi:hypothetical protein